MNRLAYDQYGQPTPDHLNALLEMIGEASPSVNNQMAAQEQTLQEYKPLPDTGNFLRNNSTGAMLDLGPSQPLRANMQLAQANIPDYAQPIDIGGMGKGYRLKGDSTKAVLNDGTVVQMGVDREATAKAQRERVAAEKALLENELLKANIIKAQRGPAGQKAPAGQRFNDQGELEWIPGSAGDLKAKGIAQKASDQLATHEAGTDALIRNIDQLIGNPDAGTAEHKGLRGSIGYLDAKLPPINRDQATAQALIKGLLSKSAISGLQQIRQSGTAPGSITEREWPLFQNLIATLDPTQDEATFTEQLRELRRVAAESKARARAGYEGMYGTQQPGTQPPPPSAAQPAPNASQYVEIRTTANGQKIGKKADGTYELVK